MKIFYIHSSRSGFTLIEMLVSLALFTIVSTVTVGALLSLIGGNQRLLKQQTLTSSAIFSLDNMTREIRTGSYYYCGDFVFANQQPLALLTRDCPGGAIGVSFMESSTRNVAGQRVAYFFQNGSLWRRIANGTADKMLPDDVVVDVGASKFYVTGTDTLASVGNNTQQPTITIIMVLAGAAGGETEPLTLQTTITQRSLDI